MFDLRTLGSGNPATVKMINRSFLLTAPPSMVLAYLAGWRWVV
jgi:hypothetical protein